MQPDSKLDDITRSARLFCPPGTVVEVRVPNSGRQQVRSGYFDNADDLARAVRAIDGKAPGIYVTMNPAKPETLARAANRILDFAKVTTGDSDIVERNWMLIDADPVRVTGIASSDDEHQAAHDRAQAIRLHLSRKGWPKPLYCDSGNGAHLLYAVRLPNDTESRTLVNDCLAALAQRFDDDAVKVDKGVGNAARITKFYGTLTKKGDIIAGRPHRRARFINFYEEVEPVGADQLAELAAEFVKPAPRQQPLPRAATSSFPAFDIDDFIARNGIAVRREAPYEGGRKFLLEACVWNPDHTDNSAWIAQWPSGAIAAGCSHNSCTGKDWQALKDAFPLPPGEAPLTIRLKSAAPVAVTRKVEHDDDDQDDEPSEIRWPVYGLADLLDRPEPTWQIKGVIQAESLVMVNGESNIGKSFVVLDIALSIATGRPWANNETEPGYVLVVALEGNLRDVYARANAWKIARGHPGPIPNIGFVEVPVPLSSAAEVQAFADEVRALGATMIIFDTLALSMPGLDENATKDAGTVVNHLRWLKVELAATILIVHHSQKGNAATERGSTGFRGAMDTQIVLVASDEGFTIRCGKQRSAQRFEETLWKLEPIPDTSCVVPAQIIAQLGDASGEQPVKKREHNLTTNQRAALMKIREATLEQGGIGIRELARRMGKKPGSVEGFKDALLLAGYVLWDADRQILHSGRSGVIDTPSEMGSDTTVTKQRRYGVRNDSDGPQPSNGASMGLFGGERQIPSDSSDSDGLNPGGDGTAVRPPLGGSDGPAPAPTDRGRRDTAEDAQAFLSSWRGDRHTEAEAQDDDQGDDGEFDL